jgi:hypothetical protein
MVGGGRILDSLKFEASKLQREGQEPVLTVRKRSVLIGVGRLLYIQSHHPEYTVRPGQSN